MYRICFVFSVNPVDPVNPVRSFYAVCVSLCGLAAPTCRAEALAKAEAFGEGGGPAP